MIEPPFDRLYLSPRELRKIGLLWKEPAHQADRILDGAPFPTVERFAEVGAGAEHRVGLDMLRVLRAVVVGQCLPQGPRVAAEPPRERHAHLVGAALRQLRKPRVAGGPLDGDLERDGARARDHGVRLPVPDVAAPQDMRRALPDRDARRDVRGAVLARITPGLPPTMRPDQTRDEVPGLGIDPLVDRLVADGLLRMAPSPAPRDELGRPPTPESLGHVPAQRRMLEAPTLMGPAVARLGAVLGLVRQVVAGVDRRSIAAQLPRQRAGRAPQDRGDLPQRVAVTAEDRQDIAFMTREVRVGVRHSPRILTRRPSNLQGVALAY